MSETLDEYVGRLPKDRQNELQKKLEEVTISEEVKKAKEVSSE